MPLSFSGRQGQRENGIALHATDAATGRTVPVLSSEEAIEDYGLALVESAASDKYDAGDLEADGNVLVRTTDFISNR